VLTDAFIGEGPDIPEWQPATCEPLMGHTNDIAWEGPETIALGISSAIHDTTKSTRDNEE
jgi:hypothetical protein